MRNFDSRLDYFGGMSIQRCARAGLAFGVLAMLGCGGGGETDGGGGGGGAGVESVGHATFLLINGSAKEALELAFGRDGKDVAPSDQRMRPQSSLSVDLPLFRSCPADYFGANTDHRSGPCAYWKGGRSGIVAHAQPGDVVAYLMGGEGSDDASLYLSAAVQPATGTSTVQYVQTLNEHVPYGVGKPNAWVQISHNFYNWDWTDMPKNGPVAVDDDILFTNFGDARPRSVAPMPFAAGGTYFLFGIEANRELGKEGIFVCPAVAGATCSFHR